MYYIKKIECLILILSMILSLYTPVTAQSISISGDSRNEMQILYEDNFDDGIDKWIQNGQKYFSGITGRLVYKNITGSVLDDVIEKKDEIFANGEIDFKFKTDSEGAYNVNLRCSDATKHLVTFDFITKSIRITRSVNNGVGEILGQAQYKLECNKIYDVRIKLIENEITVFIDNTAVLKINNAVSESGCLGFSAKKGQFEIDNLIIQKSAEEKCLTAADADVIEIYVATDGNDITGDGTYEKPFATMTRAKNEVKKIKALNKPIDVIFREGTYRINKVTSFTSEDSGSAIAPITYRAAKDEKVYFSGSKVLDVAEFKPVTDPSVKARMYEHVHDKVLQMDLSSQGLSRKDIDFAAINKEIPAATGMLGNHASVLETVKLFLNDRVQNISRWPNTGFALIENCVRGATSKSTPFDGGRIYFSNPEPLRWTEAKDAYVEGLMYYEWSEESIPIKSINVNEMSIDLYRYGYYGLRNDHEYCVKNLIEEIDIPGEWYIDFDKMILYYYPQREFEDGDIFEISTLKQAFISINGTNYVNFKDITFKNSLGLIESKINPVGTDHFGKYSATNEFEDFGGGIEIGNKASNIIIDGCVFKDIGGTGVRIIPIKDKNTGWANMNLTIQNCDFYRCSYKAIMYATGNSNLLEHGNLNIKNNFFYGNGVLSMYGGMNCGFTIENNLIVKCFDHAIRCDGTEYNVNNNEINYGAYGMSDMGAIYAGRNVTEHGSSISRNLIMNYGPSPEGIRSFRTSGVYLDDCVGGITLTQNMSTARSKNYGSTAIDYGGGPDVKYYGNISADAQIGYYIGNRVGYGTQYLTSALNTSESNIRNGWDIWTTKYPEVARMKAWYDDPTLYDARVYITENLSTFNDTALMRTSFDKMPYLTGTIDDAIEINDKSIYVDADNYDYRLKMEAVKKYNLPSSLPNEENLDINTIGLQRELEYNEELINFDITYPVNGETVDYANKVGIAWSASDVATKYIYTVATDEKLENIVAKGETMDTFANITATNPNSTYYVKVTAVSEQRVFGYEIDNRNGIIEFKTPNVYYSDLSLLQIAIDKLKDKIPYIVEGEEVGMAKPGSLDKVKAFIAQAEEVINKKPEQSQIDIMTAKVLDYTSKLDSLKYTGYAKLHINNDSVWNQTAPLKSVEKNEGKVTFTTNSVSNVTSEKVLSNNEVIKFKYEVSQLDRWHAWGLRHIEPEKVCYSTDSYYVLVKRDVFELQKHGIILATKENNGIITENQQYEITFGAITMENGVNVYAEVDGKVLFDFFDASNTMDSAGRFTFYVPKDTTVTLSESDNIPDEFFEISEKAIEASILGEKTTFDTTYEGFGIVKGNFAESGYTGNPDGAKEFVTSDSEAEIDWTLSAKGDTMYEVYYYHNGAADNDNNVEIIINGQGGNYRKTVDLTENIEGYVSIGTFKFTSPASSVGMITIIIKGSGNGKLPISSVCIREVSSDKPDMLKQENQ